MVSVKIDNKKILASAVHIASRDGFLNITRESIAVHANVSVGKVSNAYGSMIKLKRAVMRQAIYQRIYSIVSVGLVTKDPTAMKIDDELKSAVLESIV